MNENGDFEIVATPRGTPAPRSSSPGVDRLASAAAENFSRILDAADAIIEIEKMKVQADVYINELREKRLMLEAGTRDYVAKVEARTDQTVRKAEVIRLMMQDYYRFGQDRLSGAAFSEIISDVLDRMGEF